MSLRNDIMRFSVLGLRSDIRIELQAPVMGATPKFDCRNISMQSCEHVQSLLLFHNSKCEYVLLRCKLKIDFIFRKATNAECEYSLLGFYLQAIRQGTPQSTAGQSGTVCYTRECFTATFSQQPHSHVCFLW